MSDREPRPGDVWVILGQPCVIGQGRTIYRDHDLSVDFAHLSGADPKARFLFNVFDLVSGEPCLIEVGDGDERRQIVGLPRGVRLGRCCLRATGREAWLAERDGMWLHSFLRYASETFPGDEEPEVLPPVEDFATAVKAALQPKEATDE